METRTSDLDTLRMVLQQSSATCKHAQVELLDAQDQAKMAAGEAQQAAEFQMDIQSVRNQLAATNMQLAEVQRVGLTLQRQGHPLAVRLYQELNQHTKEFKKQTWLQEKVAQQLNCVEEELSASQHDFTSCIHEHTNYTANRERICSAAMADSPWKETTEFEAWQDGPQGMVESMAEECREVLTRYALAEQGVSTSREMVAELSAELSWSEQSASVTSETDVKRQQTLLLCEKAAAVASTKLDECRANQEAFEKRNKELEKLRSSLKRAERDAKARNEQLNRDLQATEKQLEQAKWDVQILQEQAQACHRKLLPATVFACFMLFMEVLTILVYIV